ncbi:MAG: transposase [Candidatus Lokiarchaeota archaeon]|nr:transposase [Candidatus Lokiarchaeota archaeon]
MARYRGTTISVKVPIKWSGMGKKSQRRLRQTVGRDTRVIRAFLGVIEQNETALLTGRRKTRIDEGLLDKLTIRVEKETKKAKKRLHVPHDFKARFPRISANELSECRRTAVGMYESYLALRAKRGRDASRPGTVRQDSRIPRWVFKQRFKLIEKETTCARWWLDIRDSFEYADGSTFFYKRLRLPLKMSPFHLNQLQKGKLKALQLFTDKRGKWWVTFAVRVELDDSDEQSLPVAVLGIDLGIEKAACTALVTPEKVRETKYFKQSEKIHHIKRYDRLVADLQHEMDIRRNNGRPFAKVVKKLRAISSKRESISKEYDKLLVSQLVSYIKELSKRYTLYVSIGRLKNIRVAATKTRCSSRRFRAMIHSWAFSRITERLQHQLAQLGWSVKGNNSRFQTVPEAWTSIICWKCGSKGVRPKQNYFRCPSCGHKTNADRNGAINIAGRLITLTDSLHSVMGLGKWASAVARSKRPKARRSKRSKRKSRLSKRSSVSDSGESAAVHYTQTSLLSFGDVTESGDNDPAVASTVEDLSVAGLDTSTLEQEKEARTDGGIPSQ